MALNVKDAMERLVLRDITAVELTAETAWYKMAKKLKHGHDRKLTLHFCRQMGVMLGTGIPVLEAIRVFLAGCDEKERLRLEPVLESLSGGNSLVESMTMGENCFSGFMLGIIKAGEVSGNLADTFLRLGDILQKQQEAREKLKTAMLYPGILCVLGAVMLVFIMKEIMPVFGEVFSSFHAELPWTTALLLDISHHLLTYAGLLGATLLLMWLLWQMLGRQQEIRLRLDRLKLKLPIWGRLYLRQEQAFFLSTLGMLTDSGIRLNDGIRMAGEATGNAYLQFFYDSVLRQLEQGESLGHSLAKDGLYDTMLLGMVNVGERTGELAGMLEHAGETCRKEADAMLERLNILLEPVVMVILGLLIGFVVLSTVMPILDLMSVF